MHLSFNKKWLTLISVFCGLVLGIFVVRYGVFSSLESIQAFLDSLGIFAPLGFIGLQIIQCIVSIIPGGLSCAIGVIIFGPVFGFIYNYIGIVVGSTINFLLAKHYGKKFVIQMISQKRYDKYVSWIEKGKKFDKLFAFTMFAPGTPDDLFCFLAGLTPMSLKKFLIIIITCKPWAILAYSMGMSMAITWLASFF